MPQRRENHAARLAASPWRPQPQCGRGRKGNYIFTDSVSLEDALGNWLGNEFEDVRLSLLELRVPAGWIRHGQVQWEATIVQAVPPDRIRLLVADLDQWTGSYPGGDAPAEWLPSRNGELDAAGKS